MSENLSKEEIRRRRKEKILAKGTGRLDQITSTLENGREKVSWRNSDSPSEFSLQPSRDEQPKKQETITPLESSILEDNNFKSFLQEASIKGENPMRIPEVDPKKTSSENNNRINERNGLCVLAAIFSFFYICCKILIDVALADQDSPSDSFLQEAVFILFQDIRPWPKIFAVLDKCVNTLDCPVEPFSSLHIFFCKFVILILRFPNVLFYFFSFYSQFAHSIHSALESSMG